MSRRVITRQLQATESSTAAVDGYFDRIVKYIPADIVGVWIFAEGTITSATDAPRTSLLWVMFCVLVVITPLWISRQTSVPGQPRAMTQTVISTIAFVVWVFALGGPFATLSIYRPLYGSLLLAVYTLVIGIVIPPEPAVVATARE